jgi:hypothetical protein
MPSPKNKHSVSSPKSGNNYENWSAQEFASYLKNQHDLGQYSSLVIKHGITGKVAHTLSEKDLQEMGISSIGDRKRFQQALSQLKQSARKKQREEVLWQGTEEMWNSWWEACCSTCCGCCPRDASQYKLTGTHLVITQKDIQRCGPIKCCCGHGYHIDNVVCIYIYILYFRNIMIVNNDGFSLTLMLHLFVGLDECDRRRCARRRSSLLPEGLLLRTDSRLCVYQD